MAAPLSYGKRMLKEVLDKQCRSRENKNSPLEDARFFCRAGYDKDGLAVKYMSDYKGFGVIVTKSFQKGDFLLEYVGEKITCLEAAEREKTGAENKLFFYQHRGKKLCIDAERTTGHICQIVNDESDAACNSVMKLKEIDGSERLLLFAKKDIDQGDEILYNYGDQKNLWWRKRKSKKRDQYEYESDESDPFGLDKEWVPDSEHSDVDEVGDISTLNFKTIPEPSSDHSCSVMSEIIPSQPDNGESKKELDSTGDSGLNIKEPNLTEDMGLKSTGDSNCEMEEKDQSVERNVNSKKPDRFCVYCKELVKGGKLKRHIQRKHKHLPEIQNILKQSKQVQQIFWETKRKEGIYQFNFELISSEKEPEMRERKTANDDQLRLCAECHGFYSNRYFYKHKCVANHPSALKPLMIKSSKAQKMTNDKEFQDILNRFHEGQVGDFIRQDTTTQLIGYKHFNMRRHEEGKEDEVRKVVMCDMRELTRLYFIFRDISGDKEVGDMFIRENLQDLADSIETMASEKHGLKLLLDAVILRSVKTLRGHFSELMDDNKCKDLKLFLIAYKHKSSEIYPKARQACVKQSLEKHRRPANLPDEAELVKLQNYISINIRRITAEFDMHLYKELRTLAVARLTLFNARRGEEAPRMLLNEWKAGVANTWLPSSDVEKIEDRAERYLMDQFKLCYIAGKGRKFVPVLVPLDIIPAIEILVEQRTDYGISENNNFVFATKNTNGRNPSHCSGWHALSEICSMAGVQVAITATKMRHRLSTIYASLDMSPAQKQIFFNHMGHEEDINKTNYQCPAGVAAVKVMGRLLQDVEQGATASYGTSSKGDVYTPAGSKRAKVDLGDNSPDGSSQSRKRQRLDSEIDLGDNSPDGSPQSRKRQRLDSVDLGDNSPNGSPQYRKRQRLKSVDLGDNSPNGSPQSRKRQKLESVSWTDSDTTKVKKHFHEWLLQKNESNKGCLPSKQHIMDFLSKTNLESLGTMSLVEKYRKVRTKLFNERKRLRTITKNKLDQLTVG